MADVIVIGGAPGSGKETLANMLRDHFDSPCIDLGTLRGFHLDREWKRASSEDEAVAFENLVAMVRNYLRHGYRNIVVRDLRDARVRQLPELLVGHACTILTLVVDDAELRERVSGREHGFTDVDDASRRNTALKRRRLAANEHRLDNTGDIRHTYQQALAQLSSEEAPGQGPEAPR